MENRLVVAILGSTTGIIAVIPISLIFGGFVTGIIGVLIAGAGAYFSDDFLTRIRTSLKR
jgi:hypothetical protein